MLVRFDKRDAAGCLLALDLSSAEAAAEPAVDIPTLLALHHCSHAWLKGEVAEPACGYSQQELAAGLHRLAVGEASEAEAAEAAPAAEPRGDGVQAGAGGEAGEAAEGGDVGQDNRQAD